MTTWAGPAAGARTGQAILFGLASVALFAALDGVAKHLLTAQPALTVTWARHVTALPFALGIWWGAGRPGVSAEAWRPQIARGIVVAATTWSFFAALDLLPLAELILLLFLAPLMVPFLAWGLLKERVQAISLLALGLGFAGVLVASLWGAGLAPDDRPGHATGIGLALVSAATYALSIVMLRSRARKDGSSVTSVFAVAIPALIFLGPVALSGTWPSPSFWTWYALLGLFGAGAGWCLALAYARAQAQILAPLDYTALIWAGMIGWFFFGEVPRQALWVAGPLILAACALAAVAQRQIEQARRAETGSQVQVPAP